MAKFTRKDIRDIIGEACTEEMENKLTALHLGVVDPLKDDLQAAKAKAEKVDELEKELQAEKDKGKDKDTFKQKYEDTKKALDDLKNSIETEKATAARQNAGKKYLEGKNIKGKNLDIALRAAANEIDKLELDEKGEIKDAKALDDLIGGVLSGLVVTEGTQSMDVKNPPAGDSGKGGNGNSRAAELERRYHENLYGKAKE